MYILSIDKSKHMPENKVKNIFTNCIDIVYTVVYLYFRNQQGNTMKPTITLSNGIELKNIYSVLETLAVNGYKNATIIFKGYGKCDDKDGQRIEFKYS